MPPDAVDALSESLREHAYLADRGLATVLHLSLVLEKPLLLEGEAGVGKTELAKVLADITGGRLIRLQCYEGIDVAHALYDWSYARQLLYIRTLEAAQAGGGKERLHELFGREFLERRPLLDAIENDDPQPPVLLIDEIDRADDEFEAFLLELLSDFQVTIPEIGTIRAARRPAGDPHLEPHPRAARRAQAPLPLPLDRAPLAGARDRDRARPRARRAGAAGRRGRRLRAGAAPARPGQVAGRGRDDRLDAGAARPRPAGAGRRRGGRHPRLGAEVPRGRRARP